MVGRAREEKRSSEKIRAEKSEKKEAAGAQKVGKLRFTVFFQ